VDYTYKEIATAFFINYNYHLKSSISYILIYGSFGAFSEEII
jgi:hypothetical protein